VHHRHAMRLMSHQTKVLALAISPQDLIGVE